jgi:hypothetical protein
MMNNASSAEPCPTADSRALEQPATTYARLFAVRGRYQREDTDQTLREALAEYYTVNPGLIDPAGMDDSFGADYFHCHDVTHVIFGTHTGPLDEGLNDVLTMFGVDVPYFRYLKGFFKSTGAGAVAKDYKAQTPARAIFIAATGTLRLMPRAWRTCKAMHKKWPWDPPHGALDQPLRDLRAEYGVAVWRPEVALGLRVDR